MALVNSNRPRIWWFDYDEERRLQLKTDFKTGYLVQTYKTGKEKKTLEIVMKKEEERSLLRLQADLTKFKAVNHIFKDLIGVHSRADFSDTLSDIIKRNNILLLEDINTDNDSESEEEGNEVSEEEQVEPKQKKKTKTKFIHQMSFFEECVLMRDQHPHKERMSFLETGNKIWRKKCKEVLEYNEKKMPPFGSTFREQIYVSTLPQACFEIVEELNDSFKEGIVKTAFKKTTMTAGVFQCLVGLHDVHKLTDCLNELNEGKVSLSEFRLLAKRLKESQKSEETFKEAELIRLRQENLALKKENGRLVDILKEKQTNKVTCSSIGISTEIQRELSVGDVVEAKWEENNWFEAKVLAITEKSFKVKYTQDGIIRSYTMSSLRNLADESE